ncbi:MAG: chloride channel protein [archaeon]
MNFHTDKRISEVTVIFLNIVKWCVLAAGIGLIVGTATTLFLKALNISTNSVNTIPYYYFLIPVAFFLSAVLIKYLAPDAKGHGTEKVIEAVHKRAGKIKAAVVPIKLIATIITLASGGSAGKEGPCAQIGAGLSSTFSDLLRFNRHDRKKLVICGISAGFAAVFGTPIAGAIFGVEVLYVGSIMYDVLLPSFIAGIIGYHVAASLGITYFSHALSFVPVFSQLFLVKVILAGVFFGLCAFLFIELFKYIEKTANNIRVWSPWKGLIGGGIIVGLTLIFSTQFLGLGLSTIEGTLQGNTIVWYAFLLKMAFTSITLAFGGSGGVVTPIFFIGATAGVFFAQLLRVDVATFAAIGIVSVLAGAANTPIAASIMSVELFGPAVAPYAALACVVSFLVSGHRSIYPSQVLATGKSEDIKVQLGKEMHHLRTKIRPKQKKSFLRRFLRRWHR